MTYGHATNEAKNKPIWEIHENLAFAVECAHDKYDNGIRFSEIEGSIPIYFTNPANRRKRHDDEWKQIVKTEETLWKEKFNRSKVHV